MLARIYGTIQHHHTIALNSEFASSFDLAFSLVMTDVHLLTASLNPFCNAASSTCFPPNVPIVVFSPGPYQVNGVPLRRVNQAYVIATSMKVDLSKVTIPVADDSYFTRVASAKKTEEDQFFEQGAKVRSSQPASGRG